MENAELLARLADVETRTETLESRLAKAGEVVRGLIGANETLKAKLGSLEMVIAGFKAKKARRPSTQLPTIEAFVSECCEVGADELVAKAELFGRYRDWCEANKISPTALPVFGRDLKCAVKRLRTSQVTVDCKRVTHYRGLALRPLGSVSTPAASNATPSDLADFVAARCVFDPQAREVEWDFHRAYEKWCHGDIEVFRSPLPFEPFARAMKREFPTVARDKESSGKRYFAGIRLETPAV